MRRTIRILAAAIAAAAVFRAPDAAARIPVGTPTLRGTREPALLSGYERKVLELEYAKLLGAVRAARAEAEADESLAPLRAALAEARAADPEGGTNAVAAARALSDAVETVLYGKEGIPDKIKRLHEVGNLLEYDHRLRREQRAAASVGRALPPSPPPEEEPETGDGADPGAGPDGGAARP